MARQWPRTSLNWSTSQPTQSLERACWFNVPIVFQRGLWFPTNTGVVGFGGTNPPLGALPPVGPGSLFEVVNIKTDPVIGTRIELNCPLLAFTNAYFPTNVGIGWILSTNLMRYGTLPGNAVAFSELVAVTNDPVIGTCIRFKCAVIANCGIWFPTLPAPGVGFGWMPWPP